MNKKKRTKQTVKPLTPFQILDDLLEDEPDLSTEKAIARGADMLGIPIEEFIFKLS